MLPLCPTDADGELRSPKSGGTSIALRNGDERNGLHPGLSSDRSNLLGCGITEPVPSASTAPAGPASPTAAASTKERELLPPSFSSRPANGLQPSAPVDHRATSPLSASTYRTGADAMATTEQVKLPRRESTAEPPPPAVTNGVHNKALDNAVRTPGRVPSPQPTHLNVPGAGASAGAHKILHEDGSGYIAPKFEGKDSQMEQGP